MRRRRDITKGDRITRVNVTPIIDVALVLVIVLLVTAPLLLIADLPVNLPAARARGAEQERNLSITLGSDGALAVDREIVHPDGLRDVLLRRLAEPGNEDVLVVVRADAGAPHADVRRLLEDARAAGVVRLAIATRQKTEKKR
jgi:biopolymer transport protein ExbD